MLKFFLKKFLNISVIFLFLLMFGLSIPQASADVWEAPPGNPPNGNRSRPIDVSADPQTKAGTLRVNGGVEITNTGTAAAIYGYGIGHGIYGESSGNAYAGVYGTNTGTGWAGYFNGPLGANTYLVVGGAVQGGYVANGDLYLYGKQRVAGNLSVGGQITINGGTPGAGKVLTSDASGLATWQTPASGLPSGTSGQTLRHNGTSWITNSVLFNDGTNVGIGTTVPSEKLSVNGNATASRLFATGSSAASPGIVISGSRANLLFDTTGITGGTAFNLMKAQVTNTDPATAVWGIVGVVGSANLGGTPAASYMYLDARPDGAWNNATLKVDPNNRVGIGLTSSNRPSNALSVNGNADVTGNFGIGTTAPSAKLEVAGQIKITGGTPGAGKVLTSDASGLATWQTSAGGLWVDGGSGNIYNSNTNLVGIGTSDPRAKLGILSATPANKHLGQLALYDSGSLAAGRGGVINFGGIYQGTTQTEFGAVGAFKDNATSGQYGGYLSLFSRANGSTMAERVRITSAGDVGIGTTSPTAKLEVIGESIFGSATLNVASGHNLIYGNIDSASQGNLLLLQKESVDKFKVDKDGKVTVGGDEIKKSDGDTVIQFSSGNVIIRLGQ